MSQPIKINGFNSMAAAVRHEIALGNRDAHKMAEMFGVSVKQIYTTISHINATKPTQPRQKADEPLIYATPKPSGPFEELALKARARQMAQQAIVRELMFPRVP